MINQIEPWINYQELWQLTRVVRSTFVTENLLTKEFESRILDLTSSSHAVSIANGTLALVSILQALDIGPGDEVIVPNLTFVATSNAVLLVGATPVFCDVSLANWGLDCSLLESLITIKTRAVIAVHLYGGAADIDKISKICSLHKLFFIEDAAQGVGVKYNGSHVGTFGAASILSFYGNKTITSGEGGIVLTQDPQIARRIYQLKNHGRSAKGTFIHESIGYNYSFTEMQAAIGIAQLKKLDRIIAKKAWIRSFYMKRLNNYYQFTSTVGNVDHVHWFTTIKTNDPQGLSDSLKSCGIGSRRLFYPLHLQPCYQHLNDSFRSDFSSSLALYGSFLSLPSSFNISRFQLKYVCDKLILFASQYA